MSAVHLLCVAAGLRFSHGPSPSPTTVPILKPRKLRLGMKTHWREIQELAGKELASETRTQTQLQQLTAALHISLVLADGTSGYSSLSTGGG